MAQATGCRLPGATGRQGLYRLVGRTIDQKAGRRNDCDGHQDDQADDEGEFHQKAFPIKGSIRPKYITPTQPTIEDTAIALTRGGASWPAPTHHGPSKAVA